MSGGKILIVDDEPEIVELMKLYLVRENFNVCSTDNGANVLEIAKEFNPDLIILDVLLPGINGIDICNQLRRISEVPILFVSCKGEESDIILGLSIGGDDYITKPFSPSQLVARVKAHLRRKQQVDATREGVGLLKFPGLEIDLLKRIVTRNQEPVTLSSKEFDLLMILAKEANRVVPIEDLYKAVWGVDSNGDTRTLLVHISNLRKKIEINLEKPLIQTIRGIGYKFNTQDL